MKRFLFLFCAILSLFGANAQDRVMVIDNQTPGWLSSLMTYSQQVSVEELKVTGYINKTDMDFINSLIRYRKLQVVDLQDVTTIDENAREDRLWRDFIDFGSEKELRKMILPKYSTPSLNITKSKIDSLIVSSKDSSIIDGAHGMNGVPPRYLEIQDGVKYIRGSFYFRAWLQNGDQGSYLYYPNRFTKIKFANTIEIIESGSFLCYLDQEEYFELPKNVIRLGNNSKTSSDELWMNDKKDINDNNVTRIIEFPISPSRFHFPDSMKAYYGGNFVNGKVFIRHSYSSDTIIVGEKCDTLHANLKGRIGYFKSHTPPDAENCSYSFNTLYVPKGCVEAYQKKYTKLNIKEVQNVSSVIVSPNDKEMEVGETVKLKANISPNNAFDKRFSWTSSDEQIAIVDGQGIVTALSPGEVVISAIAIDGGVKGECNIKVLQHATGISLNPSELEFTEIGTTAQLQAEVIPENSCNKDIEWTTSNMAVCHVSQSGLVTATGYGTTVVFATAVDGGYSTSCVVHVKDLSGISEITTLDEKANARFSSTGIILKSPVKGVNIVKYSDGTIRKAIVK